LFPGLTNFRTTSFCHRSNRNHDLRRELPNNRHPIGSQQSWRILKWLSAFRLGHQQVVHINFSHRKHSNSTWLFGIETKGCLQIAGLKSIPSQCAL
jgi:hypothetical protein